MQDSLQLTLWAYSMWEHTKRGELFCCAVHRWMLHSAHSPAYSLNMLETLPCTPGTCWGLSSVLLEHAIETLQCTSGICWRLSCVLLEHDKKSTKIFPRIPGVMQKRGELFFSTSWSLQERFSCTVKDDWIKGQVETHCVSSLPWWSKSRNTITFRWAEA